VLSWIDAELPATARFTADDLPTAIGHVVRVAQRIDDPDRIEWIAPRRSPIIRGRSASSRTSCRSVDPPSRNISRC